VAGKVFSAGDVIKAVAGASPDAKGRVLAVIDDYDVGMIWEAGFVFGISFGKLPIVTYTDQNYGLNAMFRESAAAHIRGVDELRNFLKRYVYHGANTQALLQVAKDYQNFSEKVF